jgi:hypothetical protein
MAWTLTGSAIEFIGLTVAAYGLFLTWRGVAEGHPLIPLRRKRQSIGRAAAGTVSLTGSAYGYVSNPNESIDEKLARVHSVLAVLDKRISTETHDREQAVKSVASEIRAEQGRGESARKADARADTRLAVVGLGFAALGAVLQIVGSATS